MGDPLSNFRSYGKGMEKGLGGLPRTSLTRLNGGGVGGPRISGSVQGTLSVSPEVAAAARKGVRINARIKRRGKNEWDISTEVYGRD